MPHAALVAAAQVDAGDGVAEGFEDTVVGGDGPFQVRVRVLAPLPHGLQ